MPEYEAWKDSINTTLWDIKYYKGLGTSTSKEAKEYFSALDDHRKTFVWEGVYPGFLEERLHCSMPILWRLPYHCNRMYLLSIISLRYALGLGQALAQRGVAILRCNRVADQEDGDSLELAFSKKKVEQRKQWLREFKPGTFLDHSAEDIRYKDFVHQELILFSRADLLRSIPCMLDGLKPGQRKILYSCFKRNLKSDVKVLSVKLYPVCAMHAVCGAALGLGNSFSK